MLRPLVTLFALAVVPTAPAGLIAYQGFEGNATDTYGYADASDVGAGGTAAPVPLFGVTGAVTSLIGPESGGLFWGLKDLRRADGGPIVYRLNFDPLDLRGYENVTVRFAWTGLLTESGDSMAFTVNGGRVPLPVQSTSLAFGDPWRPREVQIPDSATVLDLSLSASRGQGTYWGGWDSISVTGDAVEVAAVPEPATAWLLGAAALGGWGVRRRRSSHL